MTPPIGIFRPETPTEVPHSQESLDTLNLNNTPPVLRVQMAVCVKVANILKVGEKQAVCDETIRETKSILEENNRREFLRVVYRSLGVEPQDIVLKQAIEKNTVQMYEVPWRNDLYALSLDGKNLDYLYKRNGEFYFDFYVRRRNSLTYRLYLDTLKEYNMTERLESGEYVLYKNGVKIPTLSPDYFKEMMVLVEFIIEFANFLRDVSEDLKKKWR